MTGVNYASGKILGTTNASNVQASLTTGDDSTVQPTAISSSYVATDVSDIVDEVMDMVVPRIMSRALDMKIQRAISRTLDTELPRAISRLQVMETRTVTMEHTVAIPVIRVMVQTEILMTAHISMEQAHIRVMHMAAIQHRRRKRKREN